MVFACNDFFLPPLPLLEVIYLLHWQFDVIETPKLFLEGRISIFLCPPIAIIDLLDVLSEL